MTKQVTYVSLSRKMQGNAYVNTKEQLKVGAKVDAMLYIRPIRADAFLRHLKEVLGAESVEQAKSFGF